MIFGTDLNLKKHLSRIDWRLLLFLMLFLNVKLAVKIVAIIIIYLLRFNFRFNFSLKGSRLPLFYLLILFIPFIDLIVNRQYTNINYLFVFITGIGFWLLCILAIHQVKLAVENNDTEVIHRTILFFFIINIAFSLGNIALVIWDSGAINPYRYQGQYQKYFINTGDYIKGISFDTSTTNAAINAFGVIYLLKRNNPLMTLGCMAILLLTGSNFVNIALSVILLLLFIFKSDRNQKSIIAICFMLLVVFMVKVSPQNNGYIEKFFAAFINAPEKNNLTKPVPVRCSNILDTDYIHRQVALRYVDSAKTEWLKQNTPRKPNALPQTGFGRIIIPPDDIDSKPFQHIDDTTDDKAVLLKFIDERKNALSLSDQPVFKPGLPGKVLTLKQTFNYLKNHPSKILTGTGIGQFSSKLAFRATGLGFAGGFPLSHTYINTDFLTNHLDIYLYFFSKSAGLHSLTNSPNSVYDQLLTEYGLLGLLAFAIFYLGFFAKHAKALTYGVPLLGLMLMIFFSDYWFEQLSVIILFELLLLLDIKETTSKTGLNYGS